MESGNLSNKMKKYVISASNGGISNKIKCLISSINLANKTGRELMLYWKKEPACNCNFSDLFENKIKEISEGELRKIIKSGDYEFYRENLKHPGDKKKFIILNTSRFLGFSKEDLQLKFGKIPLEIQEQISKYLKNLKFKKGILKTVENFSKKEFTKDMVGLHMRKGDFKTIKNKIGFVSSDQRFIEEITNLISSNKKIKFFLSTEDKPTEEMLKNAFNGKVITYPKKTLKREEEGAVKEALIELLLLSRCYIILGSFGSSFTEMAWFFGNYKPMVKIVIEKAALKEHLKLERRRNSFFNRLKIFVYRLITPKDVQLLGKKS